MSRAALLLALALSASAAAAAAPHPSVHAEFASPAHATGNLAAEGLHWALLLFRGQDGASFRLDLEGPSEATNETLYRLDGADAPAPIPAAPARFGAVAGDLDLSSEPWSSLYIEAEAISVATVGEARVGRADGDRPAFEHLPPSPHPRDTVGPSEPASGRPVGAVASIGTGVAGEGAPFSLTAQGVRLVRWHNATLACRSPEPCPDAGGPWSAPPVSPLRLRRLSYIGLETAGGQLEGGGRLYAMAAGGPALRLALQGSLRLPEATLRGGCGAAACPDPAGRSFLASGNLTVSGLAPHPDQPRRLQGDLAGHLEGAAFDETPAGAFLAGEAAVAVTAAVGLALLLKLLLALFARSARPPALRHPRRRQLHALISARPGLSFRDLHRAVGWPNGPLQNHLKRLAEDGVIVALPQRNTVRYFETHGRHDATWRKLAQLNDPRARRLHEWLLANPGAAQAPAVAQGRRWGWSRSATQRLLRNLADAGLVSSRKAGRAVAYEAVAVAGLPGAS